MVVMGTAVLRAAQDAKKQLLQCAANVLKEKVGNLRLHNGQVVVGERQAHAAHHRLRQRADVHPRLGLGAAAGEVARDPHRQLRHHRPAARRGAEEASTSSSSTCRWRRQIVARVASLVDNILVLVRATMPDPHAMRNTVDLLRTTVAATEPELAAAPRRQAAIVLNGTPTRPSASWRSDIEGALAQCGAAG
jgi:hypothetical protein